MYIRAYDGLFGNGSQCRKALWHVPVLRSFWHLGFRLILLSLVSLALEIVVLGGDYLGKILPKVFRKVAAHFGEKQVGIGEVTSLGHVEVKDQPGVEVERVLKHHYIILLSRTHLGNHHFASVRLFTVILLPLGVSFLLFGIFIF